MISVNGKKVMIIGMAKSGIALAKVLIHQGAKVTAYDSKKAESMQGGILELGDSVEWQLGVDATELVERHDMIMISPGVPIDIAPLNHARELGIPIIGEVEYASTLNSAPIAAITGTNGKTTTTALLGEIMALTGKKTFVVGNIGIPFISVAENTEKDDVVVAEISSFQMETADTFHPRAAAVLNLSEDHLNRHKTMQNYIDCKARIFARMTGSDTLVLNMDDPLTYALKDRANCSVSYFSRKSIVPSGACVIDGRIKYVKDGKTVDVIGCGELQIPGDHNLENALAATALAYAMDANTEVIRKGLREFKGVAHRIETVGEVKGVRFINDSKGTNCDATLRAVHAMDRPTVLLLGGYDKGADFIPLFRDLPDTIREIVALGATRQRVMDNAISCGIPCPVHICDGSFEDAVKLAFSLCEPGYNLLLSPASASWDMFDNFEQRGDVFREIAFRLDSK